ncbi:3439_t:CDS:2, partial [Acaulospora colombiana]
MGEIQRIIEDALPDIYTYSIMLGNDEREDKKAGFFGNVNEQVAQVCELLKEDEELRHGFNAIGFSQDPNNIELYMKLNIFLPDINNEYETKNETYARNLASLNKLVLVRFTEDVTVKPRDTSWFSFYDEEGDIVPVHQQPLYKQDWIGLKKLDEAGKLIFKDCEGAH